MAGSSTASTACCSCSPSLICFSAGSSGSHRSMATRPGVAILGSTGSLGTTALRGLERQRERFRVAALTAFSNASLLEEQAALHTPSYVGLVRDELEREGWRSGTDTLVEAATREDVDIVLNAVVGSAGLDA